MIAPRAVPSPWPTDHDRRAKCFALGGHDAPDRTCTCGFSAFYVLPAEPDLPAPEAAWGAVVAWGRVVECERGFRAEYARPLALFERRSERDRGEGGRRLERAAEEYGIPLLGRDELVAYAGWHGELIG
jgi:hypothetical protein